MYYTRTKKVVLRNKLGDSLKQFVTSLYYRRFWLWPFGEKLNWWIHPKRFTPPDIRTEIQILIDNDKNLRNGR